MIAEKQIREERFKAEFETGRYKVDVSFTYGKSPIELLRTLDPLNISTDYRITEKANPNNTTRIYVSPNHRRDTLYMNIEINDLKPGFMQGELNRPREESWKGMMFGKVFKAASERPINPDVSLLEILTLDIGNHLMLLGKTQIEHISYTAARMRRMEEIRQDLEYKIANGRPADFKLVDMSRQENMEESTVK